MILVTFFFLNYPKRLCRFKNLLHASFLVTLKGHKHGHVHIGNARIQRVGEGGTGNPVSPGKQHVL